MADSLFSSLPDLYQLSDSESEGYTISDVDDMDIHNEDSVDGVQDPDQEDEVPVLSGPMVDKNPGYEEDTGPADTSPLTGTAQEIVQKSRGKGYKKRNITIERKLQEARDRSREEAERKLKGDVQDVLKLLEDRGLRFGEFLKFVFDPDNALGDVRWHQFFVFAGEASQLLDWWVSSANGQAGRDEIRLWATSYVAKLVEKEAEMITKSKVLHTQNKIINQDFVTDFSFQSLNNTLEDLTPIGTQMIRAFTRSRHATKKHTIRRQERTKTIITSVALTCLGEYSHSNNLSKRMIGLYLYASGAQRQTITVLSTLGISESYTNIITKNMRKTSLVTASRSRYTGTLYQLSDSMRTTSRSIASHGLYSTVYDNINVLFRHPDQILGRHDNQQNGTCGTIVPLFRARIEDMKTSEYRSNFLAAPVLQLSDIIHTAEESKSFKKNLIYTILRIVITHGGEGFKKFEGDLAKSQPSSEEKIELHKSSLHPLPAWKIDESSILGNIEVDEAIRRELHLDDVPNASDHLRFIAGDQLSLARYRAIENIRAGQETGFDGFFGSTWMAGLFHTKIADTHGTLLTHWGKPNTGTRNPGSLWFHNTRLDRLPITLTSLPSFRVCCDLTFTSLYARILHCLLLVANVSSLEEYIRKVQDWDTLLAHAGLIYQQYSRSTIIEELRQNRKLDLESPTPKLKEGDMVFENAVLFLRDALISREFTDAIKAGDSGRVILVLKVWALSFRGNGRTKYAYEMLHLIHNFTSILSKEVRAIVLNNWLVNPTGKLNSWVEIDLMQEHLNYWIKVFYRAHGSNTSWEWLELVAPCVEVLRQLARNFNDVLGADQGSRHAPPNLSRDIETLMESLDEHNVYRVQKGRMLDDDDAPVKDVITAGFQSLTAGTKNPLAEYNEAFIRLQNRRRTIPVSLQTRTSTTSESSPLPSQNQSAHETSEMNAATGSMDDNGANPFTDTFEVVEGAMEEESTTEVALMMEDLQNGVVEPTLAMLNAEDVALDMDEVYGEWQDDENNPESSGDESEEDE